ncbi:enoyl-CoA hydratase/isomerase family protein [Gallaecimonas sp. GXIMD4217]|uniref:enoyl-CoA hydratase/isomerase family protein n=1 Tax=Gallaecimonas sp. GXIMD4217 TaxID=3131927 RepID=UPI00311B3C37
MTDVVHFEELGCANGKRLGLARLNSEKSLNALSQSMIDRLAPQLQAWEQDDGIAMVILEGAGEKAFCAGGDVRALYQALCEAPDNGGEAVKDFFVSEYRLDYQIHCMTKPVLIWGHGIIMGGGLGLMSGASHRVVTETARIAMPEITIGLYPDVGGTYFLSRMPGKSGLFLGLTGASINAADALYVGLADHFVSFDDKGALIDALCNVNWGSTTSLNHQKLGDVLGGFESQARVKLPRGQVKAHQGEIDRLCDGELAEVVARIGALETDDKWLVRARDGLRHGSPLTAHIVYRQLQLGGEMSLADCFRLEAGLSYRCGELGEFREGVRALLIDKDMKPNWRFKSVMAVDAEVLEHCFASPWPQDQHPLKDM